MRISSSEIIEEQFRFSLSFCSCTLYSDSNVNDNIFRLEGRNIVCDLRIIIFYAVYINFNDFSLSPLSPAEYTITLKRDNSESLGFSIVGGVNSSRGNSPVYIRSIAPQSIAATDGRLQSGDELISINGISTISMSQKEVVQIIKKSTGTITLTIIPRDAQL